MRSTEELRLEELWAKTASGSIAETSYKRLGTAVRSREPESGAEPDAEEIEGLARTSHEEIGQTTGEQLSRRRDVSVSSAANVEVQNITLILEVVDPNDAKSFESVQRLTADIDKLSELAENFDGEGSPPISPRNIEAAKTLVVNLFCAHGILCDEVFPTQLGGVEIEAATRYWELAIWINDPEQIDYLVKLGSERYSGNEALIDIPGKIWEKIA